MDLRLSAAQLSSGTTVRIAGSKSETNRLLLLQALCPSLQIDNASDSDDSFAMRNGIAQTSGTVDVGHAGTAMRFLTAFYAVTPGIDVILTGSPRMKQRPIGILVDALRQLGADIHYEGEEGFPPLRILGRQIDRYQTVVRADVSSQYLSALALVAPALANGIEIRLEGTLTSASYLMMTLSLLERVGVRVAFDNQTIRIFPAPIQPINITVESDWSSASYFHSIVALSPKGTRLALSSFRKDSRQGDRAVADLYQRFGVETTFHEDGRIVLSKVGDAESSLELDLSNTPDIAQTIAVTCRGLGIRCDLYGLHTLKIKETDRLEALRHELAATGASVRVTDASFHLDASGPLPDMIHVATYHDHRMALSFAPLALRTDVVIQDAGVVSKSYPTFWNDLAHVGFTISEIA
ncbi:MULTISPECIES: 3-phosphoshikimate 1-carboxyvinyltransferase [unclassified Flavobacterium]|uniref:3-phosphoshikimate 1-carboxyvinyltransferase n=1 Tax=unclassified Flavobacterium TaxID=196869 RepID=UPI001F1486F5|nr:MULTISPECIES: 3-phosphoshikimate 1-carboxyvinyltransferase [unclassified Flavobacterium]UMY65885.1 3-phosphoshikimate 1-carboxyvinyltransferase [Flavobacterium sp. HJ-32-4]